MIADSFFSSLGNRKSWQDVTERAWKKVWPEKDTQFYLKNILERLPDPNTTEYTVKEWSDTTDVWHKLKDDTKVVIREVVKGMFQHVHDTCLDEKRKRDAEIKQEQREQTKNINASARGGRVGPDASTQEQAKSDSARAEVRQDEGAGGEQTAIVNSPQEDAESELRPISGNAAKTSAGGVEDGQVKPSDWTVEGLDGSSCPTGCTACQKQVKKQVKKTYRGQVLYSGKVWCYTEKMLKPSYVSLGEGKVPVNRGTEADKRTSALNPNSGDCKARCDSPENPTCNAFIVCPDSQSSCSLRHWVVDGDPAKEPTEKSSQQCTFFYKKTTPSYQCDTKPISGTYKVGKKTYPYRYLCDPKK
eukprot:CAMPEP_0115381618 /NCGR_PEP_ID=MMETSP0271-20121206/5666_1 /TAXON_ID=71861 /ORGANISM="Scrippsiella trochoidea, Strain CCMP3099" /LENGTH=358 /DNA_ID=CAMNT_0002804909 /DNA_START=24 /DNA_END=1100 /DNA_ORIENTATION=+